MTTLCAAVGCAVASTSLGFLVMGKSGVTNAPSSRIVKNPLLGTYSSGHYPLLSRSPAIDVCQNGDLPNCGSL